MTKGPNGEKRKADAISNPMPKPPKPRGPYKKKADAV